MMTKTVRKNYLIIVCCLLFVLFTELFPGLTVSTFGKEPSQFVYIGGFPIGVVLKPRGVIVVGPSSVETELGSVIPHTDLCGGDIIESINGQNIDSVEDIRNIMENTEDMTATLSVRRGTALINIQTGLIKEDMTGEKKLGLQVRENIAGVGTVTYVKEDGSFGCLGHPITLDNGNMVPLTDGASFDCKILGCNKGVRGRAGELKGAFSSSVPNGKLYRNCLSGVYGKFNNYSGGELIEVAGRKSVCVGKASIIATVGDKTERYSAEIIKTSAQNTVSDKSMIIRITDKRLLSLSGGIVQGMSGSPIIQNNKLVGAVTHVFVSDPTKGYGIYADWMLKN